MLFKAVFLLAAIAAVSAQNRVNIRPCPNGQPTVEYFESHDCSATLCTLRRGQIFTGTAHVIPREGFSRLDVALEARWFGIPVEMPEMNIPPGFENACDFLLQGGSCPVTAGGNYWWGLQYPVPQTLPTVGSNLVIILSAGEGGRQFACGMIDAVIV